MKKTCGHSPHPKDSKNFCPQCYRRDYARKPEVKDKLRWYVLRVKYGISKEEYLALLEEQGGVCAICGIEPKDRFLSVDHDHETNQIRGLLCEGCNLGIGHLNDSVALALAAAKYLSR